MARCQRQQIEASQRVETAEAQIRDLQAALDKHRDAAREASAAAAAATKEFNSLQAEHAAAMQSYAAVPTAPAATPPHGVQGPAPSLAASSTSKLFTAQCATQAAFECLVAVSKEQSFDMENPLHQHQFSDLLGKRLTAISHATEKSARQKISHGEEPDKDMS